MGTALDLWREDPQDMVRHWREGEDGAKLMRTAHGWALESEGWVVWSDRAEGVEAEGDALQPGLFAPRGPRGPFIVVGKPPWRSTSSRLRIGPNRPQRGHSIVRLGHPMGGWRTLVCGGRVATGFGEVGSGARLVHRLGRERRGREWKRRLGVVHH